MENNKENLVSELNEVLERNFDAIKGYKKASENISNSVLRDYFNTQVNQRQEFVSTLQTKVAELGGNPVDEGSFKGNLHRTWMDVTGAVATNKEEAILEECIRGEKAAAEEYQDLLEAHLTRYPEIERIVLNQKRDLEATVRKLEQFESQYPD